MPIVTVSEPEVPEEASPQPAARPLARPAVSLPMTPRAPVRDARSARRLVAVVDVDPVWESAAIEGTEVMVVKPGDDVVATLAGAAPTRLVVNLAAPGTLAALSALRAAGSSTRFWGCLASPAREKGLPLGMIEPATRPLDPDAVLAILAGYATKGTRIVTAGADGDSLMSLRHALTRQGLSVSMAWDAKQAADLFDTVRPEVVVLDIDLPPRGGYDLVVRLGTADPVASTVLVYGEESDPAAGFAAALARAPVPKLMPRDRLLADVLGQSEVPPEERQQPQKVRALGQRR
jgi:CheY-like chemotaxis protein